MPGPESSVVSSRPSSVEAALAQLPASAEGFAVDLTDSLALGAFFEALGRFDHLVYTAGEALTFTALADYDIAAARKVFELRFFTALEAARLSLPLLKDGGSITFTSGTAALRPGPTWTIGSAWCSAMIAAGKALAIEIAPLRVNTIVPGLTRTPVWNGMSQDQQDALFASSGASLPLGRVAEPSDVAKAYLAMIDTDYVTGQTLVVDGGGVLV